MNKTDVNKILLTDDTIDLDKFISLASVIVKGSSKLNAINLHNNLTLEIKIEKNSTLVLNIFDYAIVDEVNLDIELDDGATLVLNNSFIAEEKYSLNINTKLYGNDITVGVFVHGINEEAATTNIILNGIVAGETKGSGINEYAKVINKSDNSAVLIPNLIVNTNEVEANHGVSVGEVNRDEVFYLMSKGIKESDAVKMIENGFLLSIMTEEVREKIKNILIGR